MKILITKIIKHEEINYKTSTNNSYYMKEL